MKLKSVFVFLFCIVLVVNLFSQNKGYLVIIGGGKRPDSIVEKIVELSGGPSANISIIPLANAEPLETALYQKNQFEQYGPAEVDFLICTNESANHDSSLAKLDDVTGIFFSGGSQSRLTKKLLNTKLLEKIRSIYLSGGVLAGTSAGAAVMSPLMITGDELRNQDSTRSFISIQKNNIEVTQGFAFIQNVIIDQHFVKRKRHNRLISLVLENPQLIGIGIDESTAIIVKPDDTFEVLGENSVVVYDATKSNNITTNENGILSANNIIMHVLIAGQKYNFKSKSIIN